MITHFQITSSFKFNLDMGLSVKWPELDFINGWFSWVNLDAIDLARLECYLPTNFYDGLFSSVLSATAILATVPLTCQLILAYQSLGWRFGWRAKTPKDQRIRHAFVNRAWNLFLMLCFFFFPPISKRVFNTLHCVQILPNEAYMWADLSLRCWSPTHWQWVLFSLASMAAYLEGRV